MSNLTFDEKLIDGPFSPPRTRPGYAQVVYIQEGGGLEFFAEVAEGLPFKAPLLASFTKQFVGYLVSTDSDRQHSSVLQGRTENQAYRFSLRYFLHYAVTEPRKVVGCWESDPLRRLRDAAEGILDELTRSMPWRIIQEGGAVFENAVLGHGEFLRRLQPHANHLGIAATRFRILRILDERDAGDLEMVARSPDAEQLKNLKTKLELNELDRQAMLLARQREHERQAATLDTSHGAFNEALTKAFGNVSSVATLAAKVQETAPLLSAILNPGASQESLRPRQLVGGAQTDLGKLLLETSTFLANLDPTKKKTIGPVILKLLALAIADDSSAAAEAELLVEQIDQFLRLHLGSIAERDQHFLRRIQDFDVLRVAMSED